MKRNLGVVPFALAALVPLTNLAQDTNQPAPAPAAPSEPLVWKLAEVQGTVQIKADAAAAWAAGQPDQVLPAGASVHTGIDGKAVLKAADAAGVTMQSNTTIEVTSLTQSGDTTKSELRAVTGKALFLVNKLKTQDSSFKVETPTAVVGVRGTVFSVGVTEDGESSRVACFSGEVGVEGRGAEPGYVIVKEKMGTSIVRNKPPTPAELLPDDELAEWERVKAEVQTSTIMASVVPAIGGMIEGHQIMNAEADRILDEAKLAIRGNKKSEQDFKVFWAALAEYYKDTAEAPTVEQGLNALLTNPGVKGWNGPYLDKESNLLDPYGRPYKWTINKSPGGKDIFEIRSGGPDGIMGNGDDHKDALHRWKVERMAKESEPPAK